MDDVDDEGGISKSSQLCADPISHTPVKKLYYDFLNKVSPTEYNGRPYFFFPPKQKAIALERTLGNALAVVMVADNGRATLQDVITAETQ